jgi:DNA-binding CsgD family transcriptional regulator
MPIQSEFIICGRTPSGRVTDQNALCKKACGFRIGTVCGGECTEHLAASRLSEIRDPVFLKSRELDQRGRFDLMFVRGPRKIWTLISRHPGSASARITADRAPDSLTRREHDVFSLMKKGFTNREIARRLIVTLATVRTHVSRIRHKMKFALAIAGAFLAALGLTASPQPAHARTGLVLHILDSVLAYYPTVGLMFGKGSFQWGPKVGIGLGVASGSFVGGVRGYWFMNGKPFTTTFAMAPEIYYWNATSGGAASGIVGGLGLGSFWCPEAKICFASFLRGGYGIGLSGTKGPAIFIPIGNGAMFGLETNLVFVL